MPLRAFLGFTFCFAGLQKLANPGFFHASNPASIQAQLAGAAHRSPLHALLTHLVHVAVPLGVLIALGEFAVGLGTLVGLFTRMAAVGGALISFMLFLTISYHSSPYYTGADIVFFFAWWPLVLAGSGGVLCADAIVANRQRSELGAEPASIVQVPFSLVKRVCGSYDSGLCRARNRQPCAPVPCPFLSQWSSDVPRQVEHAIDRRTFAAKGALAAALAVVGLAGAGAVAGLGRLVGRSTNGTTTPQLGAGTSPGGHTQTTSSPASAATHPPGTAVGPASDVPVGGAASFNDPKTGDPSLVVQPRAGTFLAFDAVCPHAGCTVQYDSGAKLFVCPCHGSEFDASTGAVEVGPATRGLSTLPIAKGSDGQLYVN